MEDQTVEQIQEEAFQAEMAGTDAPAPVIETPAVNAEIKESAAERVEVIAGMTEVEVKDALAQVAQLRKALDTTNGTYGKRLDEQQRIIQDLQKQKDEKVADQVASLSDAKLSRLKVEFPELAEILEEDLKQFTTKAPEIDVSKIEQSALEKVNARFAEQEMKDEIRELRRSHPDWQTVAAYQADPQGLVHWNNMDFGNWVAKQPREVQEQLLDGRSADYISEKLTEYKATKSVPDIPRPKARDLSRATMPRGVSSPSNLGSVDEEEKAFREEMARL